MPKLCKACNIEKPYYDFHKSKSRCKVCVKAKIQVIEPVESKKAEYKPRTNKSRTPKAVKNYVDYMTNNLTGNDY